MRVLIHHRSRYAYPRPALLGPHVIRLRPSDHTRARIESYTLAIQPEHRVHWQRDPHGTDAAALLGYTGAVLQRSLGTYGGRAALLALLALWLVLPCVVAARSFSRKDF